MAWGTHRFKKAIVDRWNFMNLDDQFIGGLHIGEVDASRVNPKNDPTYSDGFPYVVIPQINDVVIAHTSSSEYRRISFRATIFWKQRPNQDPNATVDGLAESFDSAFSFGSLNVAGANLVQIRRTGDFNSRRHPNREHIYRADPEYVAFVTVPVNYCPDTP